MDGSTATITMKVDVNDRPKYVTMWHATTLSSRLRDFRLINCLTLPDCVNPVIWYNQQLREVTPGSGVYQVHMNAPPSGWTGFLIELTYEYAGYPTASSARQLRVTSEVNIVPDVMPFPPCGDHCQ